MNPRELPKDRLATTDSQGNRIYLYPADVKGRWKVLRSRLSVGLIALFLGLPWVRIGGHQAILLDIPHRRFAILGLTFWAHDTPLLIFVLGGAAVSIAFVTAIWGRGWCGWACPQTVFVEQVFRRVERWIEGDSVVRRRRDQGPWNSEWFTKKALKWGVYGILSLVVSHSFLAYFVGTESLAQMMKSSPYENPSVFIIMAGVAAGILFDFGWFREQFCTVVCPYGRFQSVLMDNQSTVVAYDMKRGEPRKGTALSSMGDGVGGAGLRMGDGDPPIGDCVNCYRCVQVCPTGIDIRRGVQLECIACTACIDACDEVMTRIKKPKGLIRYGNQAVTEGHVVADIPLLQRTRAWVYLGLLLVCLGGLFFTVSHRALIQMTLIRAVDFPYQEIPDAQGQIQILNHFKVELRNQTFEDQEIRFFLAPEFRRQGVNLVVSNHKAKLLPGEPERADLFIQFPKNLLTNGRAILPIQMEARPSNALDPITMSQEAQLVGPLR